MEEEERKQLISAILPLLERMPIQWLRATYITVLHRSRRK